MAAPSGKIGYATLWTIIAAAASAVGIAAYMNGRHKDNLTEIARLRSRVVSLESQLSSAQHVSDSLRKELGDNLKGQNKAESSCTRKTDNTDIKNELIHLEAENAALQLRLVNAAPPDISGSGVVNLLSPDLMFNRLSDEYQRNLSDISELRRKLACVP